jgi:hypothetical protein
MTDEPAPAAPLDRDRLDGVQCDWDVDGYCRCHRATLDRDRLARALSVAVRRPGWGVENARFDADLIADAYEAES